MSTAGGSDLCRVTVVGPSRRVDIALPGYVSFADLFPAVARYAGLDGPDVVGEKGGWVLQRLGQEPFSPALTPLQAGLRDGEMIYLRPHRAQFAPAGLRRRGRRDRDRAERRARPVAAAAHPLAGAGHQRRRAGRGRGVHRAVRPALGSAVGGGRPRSPWPCSWPFSRWRGPRATRAQGRCSAARRSLMPSWPGCSCRPGRHRSPTSARSTCCRPSPRPRWSPCWRPRRPRRCRSSSGRRPRR